MDAAFIVLCAVIVLYLCLVAWMVISQAWWCVSDYFARRRIRALDKRIAAQERR